MTETTAFHIWVDADACPKMIREILFRAARRVEAPLTLVANQPIPKPNSPLIHAIQVAPGFDVADNEIVQRCQPGDLVITSDIPLAAEVIEKGAQALSPRGELFTEDTIRGRLNVRDFMDTLRSSGIHTGGPSAMGTQEKQAFSNHLDRILTASRRNR